jgi:hypothetical protein
LKQTLLTGGGKRNARREAQQASAQCCRVQSLQTS